MKIFNYKQSVFSVNIRTNKTNSNLLTLIIQLMKHNTFIFIFCIFLVNLQLSSQITTQTFDYIGQQIFQPWQCPQGVTEITVECWGAGGGGGGVTIEQIGGSGGGGGAYASSIISVTPGITYYMYVGWYGFSALGLDGFDGEYAIFGQPTGNNTLQVLVGAVGGKGGGKNQGTPGKGGKASECIGNIVFSGVDGQTGTSIGGAGGNGSGPSGVGTGSLGGGVQTSGTNGLPGVTPGGGGGGAKNTNMPMHRKGGTGGFPRIILTYTITNTSSIQEENSVQTIQMNFVNNLISIENFSQESIISLQVYDMMGKLVKNSHTPSLCVNDLQHGVYIVKFQDARQVFTRKIFIE